MGKIIRNQSGELRERVNWTLSKKTIDFIKEIQKKSNGNLSEGRIVDHVVANYNKTRYQKLLDEKRELFARLNYIEKRLAIEKEKEE